MKVTFYCFNYYSLFVSYVYAEELRKRNSIDCILLWRNTIFDLPINCLDIFDKVFVVDFKKISKNILYRVLLKAQMHTLFFGIMFKQLVFRNYETLKDSDLIFVFKDENPYDYPFIVLMKKLGGGLTILIEEGLSLYNRKLQIRRSVLRNEYQKFKRLLFGLARVPFVETNLSQGENPVVDFIICSEPNKLTKYQQINKTIIKQTNLFSEKNIEKFLIDIFDYNLKDINKIEKCDFIYFGQPNSELGVVSRDSEVDIIGKVLQKIDASQKISIKRHPVEDITKYDQLLSKFSNASMLDEKLQDLPGEFLYYILEKPTIVTSWSSISKNIRNMDKNAEIILIYRMYDLDNTLLKFLDSYFDKNSYSKINDTGDLINKKIFHNTKSREEDEIVEINKVIEKLSSVKPKKILSS